MPPSSCLETHIRSALFNVFFFTSTALMVTIGIPILLLPKSIRSDFLPKYSYAWVSVVYFLEKLFLKLDYTLIGAENIPQTACIFVVKHQSAWETFKIYRIFGQVAIILKKELVSIPLWGRFLDAMPTVPIDRSKGREAFKNMQNEAHKHIKENRSILIFPQGTRVKPETTTKEKPYKTGAARLAHELKVPVVPVALNTGIFWPKMSWLKKSGTITVEIRNPISPEGISVNDLHDMIVQEIELPSQRLMKEVTS